MPCLPRGPHLRLWAGLRPGHRQHVLLAGAQWPGGLQPAGGRLPVGTRWSSTWRSPLVSHFDSLATNHQVCLCFCFTYLCIVYMTPPPQTQTPPPPVTSKSGPMRLRPPPPWRPGPPLKETKKRSRFSRGHVTSDAATAAVAAPAPAAGAGLASQGISARRRSVGGATPPSCWAASSSPSCWQPPPSSCSKGTVRWGANRGGASSADAL